MPQTIVCSICSRQKDPRKELLPARERYLGTHIRLVEGKAARRNLSFFVLSGKYGLIPGDECIEHYDYLLEADGVAELAKLIKNQLAAFNISKVCFYTKLKPNWEPYRTALQIASDAMGVEFSINELADTD